MLGLGVVDVGVLLVVITLVVVTCAVVVLCGACVVLLERPPKSSPLSNESVAGRQPRSTPRIIH